MLCVLGKSKAKLFFLLIMNIRRRWSTEVLPGRVGQEGLEHIHCLCPLPVLMIKIMVMMMMVVMIVLMMMVVVIVVMVMVALIMTVIIIKDEGDLVKQCERDGVSERPLQDGVVLPWYHLVIAIVIVMM